MRYLFFFFFSLTLSFSCFGISCINQDKKEIKARIIYLHGMDSLNLSSQELSIRNSLKKLSDELGVEVALPRAFENCPENKKQICWMWGAERKVAIKLKKERILKETQRCFKSSAPLFWLGFSNGGNLISQIFQECEEKGKYITFGASGGYIKSNLSRFGDCGSYKAVIGKDDKWNYSDAIKFYSSLKKKGGQIDIVEHQGGHEVSFEILEKIMKKYIK